MLPNAGDVAVTCTPMINSTWFGSLGLRSEEHHVERRDQLHLSCGERHECERLCGQAERLCLVRQRVCLLVQRMCLLVQLPLD